MVNLLRAALLLDLLERVLSKRVREGEDVDEEDVEIDVANDKDEDTEEERDL